MINSTLPRPSGSRSTKSAGRTGTRNGCNRTFVSVYLPLLSYHRPHASQDDGGVDTVTIPNNLAPGNYLIRHEIIALHLATQRGMAEFYPGCAQLRISGSQTGKPVDSELVSLPGAYSDDDPGIYDPSVYNPQVDYVFPGPPVAAFVTGSNPTPTKQIPSASTSATQTPTPPKSSGKTCKLKRRPLSSLEVRVHTGVIRRIVFPWSH